MTIKLTSDIRHGGAIVPANTTVTYDPAVEADLVARKSATYVGAPATTDLGVPAMVKQNILTGDIVKTLYVLTQMEYDAIVTKCPTTLYLISGA